MAKYKIHRGRDKLLRWVKKIKGQIEAVERALSNAEEEVPTRCNCLPTAVGRSTA